MLRVIIRKILYRITGINSIGQFTPTTIAACFERFGYSPLEVTCRHNIYLGMLLHPLKRLFRRTDWRMIEVASQAMNAADKVMIVVRPSND
jgi:hypothetical protein